MSAISHNRHTGVGGPSGSIVSNAKDLVKWVEMLVNAGVGSATGTVVVDPQVLSTTMTPQIVTGRQGGAEPFNKISEGYGLGWYTGFYNGEKW